MSFGKHSMKNKSFINSLQNITEKYKNEILIFILIFLTLFCSTELVLYRSNEFNGFNGFNGLIGSNGNVEQWINMTNQFFYSEQDFLFSYGPLYWLTGAATVQYNEFTYWVTVLFISLSNACFWTLLLGMIYKIKNLLFFMVPFLFFLKPFH